MNIDNISARIEHFFDDMPADTAQACPDRYFERLGGLCALLLAADRKDLTADNVSVSDRHPVISGLQPTDPIRETQRVKMLRRIDPSLYFSLFNSNLIFRYSGFTEDTLLIPKDGLSPLLPIVDGRPLRLRDHQEPFFKGFSDTYRQCMSDPAFRERPIPLSEEDLQFELTLLRSAVREQHLKEPLQRPKDKASQTALTTKEEYILEAEHIFRTLKSSILISPGGNRCFFYTPLMMYRSRKNLSGIGLTKGLTGIAVFTTAVSKYAQDAQIRDEAAELTDALLAQTERYLDYFESLAQLDERSCTVSFSEGLSGLLFAALRIRQILNAPDARLDRLIQCAVGLILRSETSGYLPECYSGLAGVLKVFCSFDEIFALPGVGAYCEKLGDLIVSERKQGAGSLNLWPLPIGDGFMSGIAHGQIGIASALYTAGNRLGREDLLKAASDGFVFEDEVFDPKTGSWPDLRPVYHPGLRPPAYGYCVGAAGVGLAMLGTDGEIASRNLNRAVSACLQTDLLPTDNLCCGNSSVIDFLAEAGRALHRDDLIAEAENRLRRMYRRSFDDAAPGYRLPSDHMLSTLYYGLPGIGYTILRAALPDRLPDILLK